MLRMQQKLTTKDSHQTYRGNFRTEKKTPQNTRVVKSAITSEKWLPPTSEVKPVIFCTLLQ